MHFGSLWEYGSFYKSLNNLIGYDYDFINYINRDYRPGRRKFATLA